MTDTYQEVLKNLRSKYKKQALTIQETASELSVSLSSLRMSVREGRNIPSYRVVGTGTQRRKVIFPIHNVAKFLSDTQQVY